MTHSRFVVWHLLVIVFLAGCVSRPDVAQSRHREPAGEIWGEQTVGQTFIARKNGLNRIDVLLATYARDNTGPVVFHLRENPAADPDLVSIPFDATDVLDNANRTFPFPPLHDSQNQSYYFFLEAPAAEPGNAITAWASTIDVYSQGQSYVAGEPQPGDLVFRTYAEYDLLQIGRDLWHGLRRHAATGLLAALLFLAPGCAVLALLYWRLAACRSKFVDSPGRVGVEALAGSRQVPAKASTPECRSDKLLEIGDWRLGQRKRCLVDSAIVAAGLSVAMSPLLILLASLVGIRLSRGSVIALLILFATLAVLPPLRRRLLHPVASTPSTPSGSLPIPLPAAGSASSTPLLPCPSAPAEFAARSKFGLLCSPAPLLLLIFIITLATRLLVVQELVAPMWGDSYHHTVIAQLMADHGGLFQSWEPYAPLRSFTYHFGFHSNVALFHWLTGMPVLESVIIVGQILNALAPLMIYPLVRRLDGTQEAGIIAVLIASLLSPTPAHYVNWGRYTQLTGMVILPLAATLAIGATTVGDKGRFISNIRSNDFSRFSLQPQQQPTTSVVTTSSLETESTTWRRLVLASVAVAGLVLSHYLVTLLYTLLLLAYLAWWTGTRFRQGNRRFSALARPWLQAGAIGIMAGILIAPWIPSLLSGPLPRVLAGRFGGGVGAAYFQTAYNVAEDVFDYAPLWLVALAAASAVWGWWQRWPLAIVMSMWTALLVLIANPNIIGLPGSGVVNNFTVLIALYLPLSITAGSGLAHLVGRVSQRIPYARLVVAGLIFVAALAGARLRLSDLDYRYRLVTPADREAMQWIRDHTPEDAKFLVNAFTAFGGYTVVGNDAGWWIPYLAGRRNTVPPATYGLELPSSPDYPTRIGAFHQKITALPLDSSVAVQALRANGVTHVYIGAVGGELLDPVTLINSPFYHLVYQRDGAMVFELQ